MADGKKSAPRPTTLIEVNFEGDLPRLSKTQVDGNSQTAYPKPM